MVTRLTAAAVEPATVDAAVGAASPLDKVSAEMAQFYWYCSSSKAERDLGWVARDPNETLADTVADLRQRGVVWPS